MRKPPSSTICPAHILFALFTLGPWLHSSSLAEQHVTAAPRALFSGDSATGWTAEADLRIGTREFVSDGELIEADLRFISATVGFHLLPFLQPWLEAGTSKADQEAFDGENGVLFGGGVTADLIEWIIAGNPSLKRKRVLTLGGDLSLRRYESNFAAGDFIWTELEVNPGLTYTHNRLGEGEWLPYHPIETAFRGSLVFSQIDGDYGTSTVEGNRNFGFRFGFDMLWQQGVTTRLDATLFGDKDRMLGLGIGYHF